MAHRVGRPAILPQSPSGVWMGAKIDFFWRNWILYCVVELRQHPIGTFSTLSQGIGANSV